MPGENIIHVAGTRIRLTGSGNLKMQLQSLDNVQLLDLVPFVMQSTNSKEPFRLSNYVSQRCKIKVYTTEINEVFRINRIILFAKDLWKDYPSVSQNG